MTFIELHSWEADRLMVAFLLVFCYPSPLFSVTTLTSIHVSCCLLGAYALDDCLIT